MTETVTLDQVLEVQGDEWARGGRPTVEELLHRFPEGSGDSETTKWLLVGEIILRRDRESKSALAVEIERRFPLLAKEVWEYLEFSDSCGFPTVEHDVADDALPIKTAGSNSDKSDSRETTCIVANLLAANDLALTTPRNAQDPTDLKPVSETSGANRPRLPRIADYYLLREIGRGGFGKVYLGKNAHDGSEAAVKVLGRGSGIEVAGVSQFKRSAGGHPHLVPILHMGKVTKFVYYTMPLADAYRPDQSASGTATAPPTNALSEEYRPHTLELEIAQRGKLTVEESLDLLRQLLSALERLHRNQIVHCDVKPANILRIDGVWKLGDMGLAIKSSPEREATGARGTRAYWPPEGPRGDSTDDLFALGLTIWVASTGKPTREFFVAATGKGGRSKIADAEHERLLRCVDRLCRSGSHPPFSDAATALAQLPLSRPMRRQARMRAILVIAMGLMATVGAAAVWIAAQKPPVFQTQDLLMIENRLAELRNLAGNGDWSNLKKKCGEFEELFHKAKTEMPEALLELHELRDLADLQPKKQDPLPANDEVRDRLLRDRDDSFRLGDTWESDPCGLHKDYRDQLDNRCKQRTTLDPWLETIDKLQRHQEAKGLPAGELDEIQRAFDGLRIEHKMVLLLQEDLKVRRDAKSPIPLHICKSLWQLSMAMYERAQFYEHARNALRATCPAIAERLTHRIEDDYRDTAKRARDAREELEQLLRNLAREDATWGDANWADAERDHQLFRRSPLLRRLTLWELGCKIDLFQRRLQASEMDLADIEKKISAHCDELKSCINVAKAGLKPPLEYELCAALFLRARAAATFAILNSDDAVKEQAKQHFDTASQSWEKTLQMGSLNNWAMEMDFRQIDLETKWFQIVIP